MRASKGRSPGKESRTALWACMHEHLEARDGVIAWRFWSFRTNGRRIKKFRLMASLLGGCASVSGGTVQSAQNDTGLPSKATGSRFVKGSQLRYFAWRYLSLRCPSSTSRRGRADINSLVRLRFSVEFPSTLSQAHRCVSWVDGFRDPI